MRSVGFGLAVLATTLMVTGPALAADSNGKKATKKPAPKTSTTTTTSAQTTSGGVSLGASGSASGTATPTATATTTTATTTTTTTETTTETAKPAPAAVRGNVVVHIDSPDAQVALEKRGGGEAWAHVCNSPCDTSVSVSDEYRIVGTGLNESNPFFIDGSTGDKVTLNVSPGRKSKYTTGIWVLGAGAVGIVGGVVVIAAGASNAPVPGNDGSTTTSKNTNFIWGGTAIILGGVVASIFGGSMMIDNAHTQVNGPVATPQEKKDDKTKGLSVQVTASRTPTWHEEAGPQQARASFVPLLGGSF